MTANPTAATLGAWHNASVDRRLEMLRTAQVARIESYDSDAMTVSVQPLVQAHAIVKGQTVVETLPVITDVPVVFPGSHGARIEWTVNRGDTVLLVFSEYSLDVWKQTTGVVDPLTKRRHHLSDAIAIFGLLNGPATKRHNVRMEFTETEIQLGAGGAVQSTVKAETYRSAEDTLISAINTWAQAVNTALISIPAFVDPAKSAFATATAALSTAVASFQASASSYLTTVVKVR